MIINICGTHGSGKSTIVRKVMALYECEELWVERRKRPIGYVCRRGKQKLFVPGSYAADSATGGCDTIQQLETSYRLIRKYARKNFDILYEGIVVQHSSPNITRLFEMGYEMSIVMIDIPLDKCIASVIKRRADRGETAPFNPLNTENEVRNVTNRSLRLKAMGLNVIFAKKRRAALDHTLKLLGLPT